MESLFNKNLFADVIVLFLNIRLHLPWQLPNCHVPTWIRKAVYLFNIYLNMFVNIRNFQILILSRKIHSLEMSYLQKLKIEIENVSPQNRNFCV